MRSKLTTLTSGIVVGGAVAIVCDMLGVSRLAAGAMIVGFAFGVLVHDVRAMMYNATGVRMTWAQTVALCVIGPITALCLRLVCSVKGHASVRLELVKGTDFMRPLVARCVRCNRVVRDATADEAKEFLRDRLEAMNASMAAAFGGVADDAVADAKLAMTDLFEKANVYKRPLS